MSDWRPVPSVTQAQLVKMNTRPIELVPAKPGYRVELRQQDGLLAYRYVEAQDDIARQE